VNNAAIHVSMADTILTATDVVIDVSLQTNAFGPLELVKALLLQIKAGRAPIVNVSSAAGSIAETVNPDSPYALYDTASYRLSNTMLNDVSDASCLFMKPIKDCGLDFDIVQMKDGVAIPGF
jgi:NAD(P)-dependent dehydrogenase (short-subunit alcohol dehydrogenase family)